MNAWQRVCASTELIDGGPGHRFEIERDGERLAAFAIRYKGRVHAYLNRCAHVGVELDWNEGDFFGPTGEFLVCSTHGALYAPATGHCFAGPCKGKSLVPLTVSEEAGEVRVRG